VKRSNKALRAVATTYEHAGGQTTWTPQGAHPEWVGRTKYLPDLRLDDGVEDIDGPLDWVLDAE
jgi:hypothetical protein